MKDNNLTTTIMQNLYLTIGKQTVQIDALKMLNQQAQSQQEANKSLIEALQKEVEELKSNKETKEDGTGSN